MRNVLALNVPVVSYERTPRGDRRLLQGGAAPDRRAARRRARRGRHDRAVARRRHVRSGLPVHGRGLRQGERRRGSARAVPHRVAGILRRRSACRSSPAAISPTPIAATASRSSSSARAWRSGCSRTRTRVNRHLMWTDPVMKFIDVSTGAAPHRRHRRRHRRRERRAGAGADRVSPVRAGDRRRPAVRPRADRSLRAGAADHADHPRPVGRSAGRAGGDARRHPRGSAGAGSAERAGVRRLRRRGADRSPSSAWPACWRSR